MRDDTRAVYPKDWDKIAAKVKAERGNRCEFCGHRGGKIGGRPNPITTHHLNYDPSDCRPENLIVLCAACHLKLQQRERVRMRAAIVARGNRKLRDFRGVVA